MARDDGRTKFLYRIFTLPEMLAASLRIYSHCQPIDIPMGLRKCQVVCPWLGGSCCRPRREGRRYIKSCVKVYEAVFIPWLCSWLYLNWPVRVLTASIRV